MRTETVLSLEALNQSDNKRTSQHIDQKTHWQELWPDLLAILVWLQSTLYLIFFSAEVVSFHAWYNIWYFYAGDISWNNVSGVCGFVKSGGILEIVGTQIWWIFLLPEYQMERHPTYSAKSDPLIFKGRTFTAARRPYPVNVCNTITSPPKGLIILKQTCTSRNFAVLLTL